MKLTKSKQFLADAIHASGKGWPDGANWAAQDGSTGMIAFFSCGKPTYRPKDREWLAAGSDCTYIPIASIKGCNLAPNWHQTVLSREEYFHLYPAPDADGWIEWNGGECPVGEDVVVEIKTRDGEIQLDQAYGWNWSHEEGSPVKDRQIIAYRINKPEQAKPEYCESVMRSIPEPSDKPTIEQLAADYRNKSDFAERKQQGADAAKADAEAKLAELVAAGKALGLVLSVVGVAPEPELVIADWRDLQVGDIIEYVDGRNKNRVGMVGRVDSFDLYNADTDRPVRMASDDGQVGWPTKWRFIRRP